MLVAYYRVSTQRQGQSGLGLEGQEAAVKAFAERNQERIAASFTEVESGRKNDRPELAKALALAKRLKATLVVAKLDRLARNVAFLSSLMESKVGFVACDNPHATKLTIHILAAVAENEADMISARTKAALAALKARGAKLGASNPRCQNLNNDLRRRGHEVAKATHLANRRAFRDDVQPVARELKNKGLSLLGVATHLNELGYRTRRGRAWTLATVHQLLKQESS